MTQTLCLLQINKEVADISWDSVKKTISNSGAVWRNLRRLRTFIESKGISENFLKYIKFHLENWYSVGVPDSSWASGIFFNYLVSSYKIAEFLMPFQITSVSIKLPFNAQPCHLGSRKQLVSIPTTIIVNESKYIFLNWIDTPIKHLKVTWTEENTAKMPQKNVLQKCFIDELNVQDSVGKCASKIIQDTQFIMDQIKTKAKLYNYFNEYVKQRLKEEKENANSIEKYNTASIVSQQDVEDRLWYVEQFIEAVYLLLNF